MIVIQHIGAFVINFAISAYGFIRFTLTCLIHSVNPKSYHPAMRMVLTKQIYFTTVQIIPLFVILAILLGSVMIGVVILLAREYGLQNQIGDILVTFVMNFFAPFFIALLIAVRSGAAINTEIAVMKVNHELQSLKSYHINYIDYLVLPRIISGVVSVVSLSLLFTVIMLSSGYIFTLLYMNLDYSTYKHIIVSAIGWQNVSTLLLKSLVFGIVVMLIPIYRGLKTKGQNTGIPIAVMKGMLGMFISIFFIEAVSLVIQYLL